MVAKKKSATRRPARRNTSEARVTFGEFEKIDDSWESEILRNGVRVGTIFAVTRPGKTWRNPAMYEILGFGPYDKTMANVGFEVLGDAASALTLGGAAYSRCRCSARTAFAAKGCDVHPRGRSIWNSRGERVLFSATPCGTLLA